MAAQSPRIDPGQGPPGAPAAATHSSPGDLGAAECFSDVVEAARAFGTSKKAKDTVRWWCASCYQLKSCKKKDWRLMPYRDSCGVVWTV